MPKPLKALVLIAALLGVFLALLYGPLPSAAQATNTYFVTNVDKSHFPDITFTLRAVDINNKVLTNLNNTSFTVYDDGHAVTGATVTAHNDAALNIIYVLDLGNYSIGNGIDVSGVRQAINTLVTGGYFAEGRDTVQVLARQNLNGDQTVELRHSSTKGSDLTDWAGTYDFPTSPGLTKGLLGVADALKDMSTLVPTPGTAPSAIIFITRAIEDPNSPTAVTAATALAQTARSQFVSIYVMHTDVYSTQYFAQALQPLATGSNGIYVALQRNNIANLVTSIYQTIAAQRGYYTVTYRSQLQTSGTRQITIDSATAPTSGLPGSYDISVVPPTVEIIQPGHTVNRSVISTPGSSQYSYDNLTAKVTASISWPPGVAGRSIKLAELLVNGNVEDHVVPAAGATTVDFTWNISGIAKPGANPNNNLVVRVTDELGIQASSAEYTVDVEVAPPPPTPTVAPTVTPVPTPTVAVGQALPYFAVALVCLGLLLVLGLALFALSRLRGRPAGRAPAGSYEAPNTMIVGSPGSGQGLASLTVLEGPTGVMGEVYSLVKPVTVIGRNPGRCDIVFYPNQESSMSRVHCTIQQDGMYFSLTDNRSSNGTSVNGTAIKPNDPVQLRDGDEIVLGQLAKLGVKLRFNQRAEKAMSDVSDRTFIVDDFDKQGFDKFKDGQ